MTLRNHLVVRLYDNPRRKPAPVAPFLVFADEVVELKSWPFHAQDSSLSSFIQLATNQFFGLCFLP